MTDPLRWAIAGTGQIAGTLAKTLNHSPEAELVAVASRAQDRADDFAARFDIPQPYGSYEAMARDREVDVVYVATPHHRHCADTILYLDSGKHVLCEKPLAINPPQVAAMIEAADRNKRFLMEAIWTRFLPAIGKLTQLIADNAIGEVIHVEATFGAAFDFMPEHRLFDMERAGGSLLDLGLYPVQLIHRLLGTPTKVTAQAHIGTTGVDEHTVVTMSFANGALAVAASSLRANLACTARIAGTKGVIDVPKYMHCPDYVELQTAAGRERFDLPKGPYPFEYEVDEVTRQVRCGQRESPIMPWSDSLTIAMTLELAREAIGLRYPQE
ncbi:MAG: Gfo/Idh/MocA family protein [Acidimicrobiales bacterium]